MTDVMLKDSEARTQALDVGKSCIVQAPAGSGKTGLLTQRLLRLLLTVDQPEQVLAITFTRKAANEMRARVIRALNAAQREDVADNDYEAQVLADARAVLAHSARLGWSLHDMPMRLAIMTVDGLNTRLTSTRPYQARNAGIDILNAAQTSAIYGQAADALFDWLTETGPIANSVTHFFDHIDVNASRWRKELLAMLGKRDQWLPRVLAAQAVAPQVLRENSEHLLSQLIVADLERVDSLFDHSIRDELIQLINEAIDLIALEKRDDLQALQQWPDTQAVDLSAWRTIAFFVLTNDTAKPKVRSTVNVAQGFPPAGKASKESMKQLLTHFAGVDGLAQSLNDVRQLPEAKYTDAQWQSIEALLTLLPALAAELGRLMNEAGKLDYPALAATALQALGNADQGDISELALQLDYRLMHILVDEMQDTSVAQYRLIESLTYGWQVSDGRTLFCVGDPMQSIYRFRGAQVSLFLKAWDEGIGDIPLVPITLQTNFRSHAGIVEWVNERFPQVMGSDTDLDLERVRYSASVAAPFAEQGGDVQWHMALDSTDDVTQQLVATVRELRLSDPHGSIAILGRTRSALEPVLEALQAEGIGASGVEMDRLTDLPEILDLLSLTRAVQHPLDDVAWLGLLRAPFVGVSLSQIDALIAWRDDARDDQPVPTIYDALQGSPWLQSLPENERSRIHAFCRAFGLAMAAAATQPLHQRVLQLWYRVGGATLLCDVAQLHNVHCYIDTLASLESNGAMDQLGEFVSLLDEQKVDRRGDSSGVSAMTMFKAKGLEFDHVLLPALEKTSRSDEQHVLYFEADSEARGLLISAKGASADDTPDKLHALIARRERQRRRNELQRLFYVACTRAKKSLHLFANVTSLRNGDIASPKTDSLLGVSGQPVQELSESDLSINEQNAAKDSALSTHRPKWHRLAAPFVEPPPAMQMRQVTSGAQATRAVTFDWAGTDARHVGTVVHEWLYEIAGSADAREALPQPDILMNSSRDALSALGVGSDSVDAACRRVIQMLASATSSQAGRWIIENTHADSAAELSLAVRTPDGDVSRVVLDRVVRDDDGMLWIVDYKTSQHEGAGLDAFFANEVERYREQLTTYRTALIALYGTEGRSVGEISTALFFPAYGKLVTVETAIGE